MAQNKGFGLGGLGGGSKPCCCNQVIPCGTCIGSTGTITATDTFFGFTWTLSYGAIPFGYGTGWGSTAVNYSFPGNTTCSAFTVPIILLSFLHDK